MNAAAAAIAAVACLCTHRIPHVSAFAPSQSVPQLQPGVSSRWRRATRNLTPHLASTSTDDENDGQDSLVEKARKIKLEAKKMEAELTLSKISKLENKVHSSSSDSSDGSMRTLQDEIEALAKLIDPQLVDATATSTSTCTNTKYS